MPLSIALKVGSRAREHITKNGLKADDIKTMAGAAGGPKWLILSALDRYLFGTWFQGRTQPLDMIGSSIGSWRFATAGLPDPVKAFRAFEVGYMSQRYTGKPSAAHVTGVMDDILTSLFSDQGVKHILQHRSHRLHVVTALSRLPVATDRQGPLLLGLASLIACNLITAKAPEWFFKRIICRDPRSTQPLLKAEFPHQTISLTPENFRSALLASGSIPLVMTGVRNIAGGPHGLYRDGGLLDYHLNVPYSSDSGLILMPHFGSRIIPGWFDKNIKTRVANPAFLENVIMVHPTDAFIATLPGGEIPDRSHFKTMMGRDEERLKRWKTSIGMAEQLAADFASLAEKQNWEEVMSAL